ncbi:MAG TPA: hypothetical protein VL486_15225 [Verrucomicrobiae bacterium]|nr:hypothetical protein [Verrucomicrobiae bacterium]
MNPDELKELWHDQLAGRRLTLDAGIVLRQIEQSKRDFEATMFWRDVREVGAALLAAAFFLWFGIKDGIWPLLVAAALTAGVGVFMVVDRYLQRRRRPPYSDPLLACAEESLAQIDHQIWLLKNVFWWCLLPLGLGCVLFWGQSSWTLLKAGLWRLKDLEFPVGCVLLYWGVYHLNQYAVKKAFEPRRQETEALLQNLKSNAE